MTASIARYLKDFSELPPAPPVMLEPDDTFDLADFTGVEAEPVIDLEAERADAHRLGYEAATEELQSKWAEEREVMKAAHAAELADLRERYETELAAHLSVKLGEMALVVAEAVGDQVTRVLAPLVEEALVGKAIADMADLVRAAILDGDVATITVRGPQALRDRLAAALGEEAAAVRYVDAADLDISADLGDAALVTRLSAWSARVRELLA